MPLDLPTQGLEGNWHMTALPAITQNATAAMFFNEEESVVARNFFPSFVLATCA